METFFLGAVNRETLHVERVTQTSGREIDALYAVEPPTLSREIAILGALFEGVSVFLHRVRRVKMEDFDLLSEETKEFADFLQSNMDELYVTLSSFDPSRLDREVLVQGQKLAKL